MEDFFSDEYFMKQAILEAKKGFENDEVPIGAVIVSNNQIIARAHNSVESLNDATAHAEILAITSASNFIGSKYLNDCSLYVTIEPCPMCAGAISWSQIGKVVIGAYDPKKGYSKFNSDIIDSRTEIISGILDGECSDLIKQFFKLKR
ncbi:nucleoside deaminase [Bacteroidota bacterium]